MYIKIHFRTFSIMKIYFKELNMLFITRMLKKLLGNSLFQNDQRVTQPKELNIDDFHYLH